MKYHTPLALTVLSGIFLALGAVFAIVVATDILIRKGWRSMMGIMYVTICVSHCLPTSVC